MTITVKSRQLGPKEHHIICEVKDARGVVRGFTRRKENRPLFLLGRTYKEALKRETVIKAQRVCPDIAA